MCAKPVLTTASSATSLERVIAIWEDAAQTQFKNLTVVCCVSTDASNAWVILTLASNAAISTTSILLIAVASFAAVTARLVYRLPIAPTV